MEETIRKARQESEDNYRSLVENFVDGIIIIQGTEIRFVNRALLTMFGCQSEDEMVGHSFTEFVSPAYRNLMLEIGDSVPVAREKGKLVSSRYEFKAVRKDGSEFDAELFVSTITYQGSLTQQGIIRDISEHKRALEALRESEEKYRGLFENSTDFMFTTDLEGNFTDVNQAAERLTGYTRAELIGMNFKDYTPENTHEKIFQAFHKVFETGEPLQDFPLEVIIKDGSKKYFETSVTLLRKGKEIIGFQGSSRDVTDHKRAEKALAEEQQLLRALMDNLPDHIYFKDTQSRFIRINQALANWFHLSDPAQAVGKTDFDFFTPEHAQQAFSDEQEVMRTGRPLVGIEEKETWPDGQDTWVSTTKVPMIDQQGHIVGTFGISRNITERKRAEQEKAKLEEQLRQSQKIEAIGRLAGGIAHDFNNLLTAISGYTELLLADLNPNHPMRADLQEIKKAADRAASLTRQLLAFSRRQLLQPKVLNLNEVVANMDNMLRRLIGEDIDLVTMLEPNLGRVKADHGQIEQVILNLVVNARDAIPQVGQITIKTKNVVVDETYCKVVPEARPGKFVCLSVQDTGMGMNKTTLDQIFEPFFSTKGPAGGTGLGLSVVYGIVKQHEGWITVYSEPGQGSTFKVYLPVFSVPPEDEPEKTISLQELQGNGERILLVEDEETVREFTSRALGENGYVVVGATSAEEALEVFEREKGKFHLVFTDVVLPGQNGLQLVDQLLSRNSDLRVLLSSGYTDQKSQWPLIRERGFRFIQKPYVLTDLLGAVREAILAS